MKTRYYPEDDLLVLRLSEQAYDHAEKVGTFIIHYTPKGEPSLLEILHASRFLKEAAEALPYPMVAKLLQASQSG